NWYPSKHEFHRQVPTWNYQIVHAHGTIHMRDDERFVRGAVARLTREHEARTGSDRPWKMGDSTAEYIDAMLARIVGIEIEITCLIGKSKLSQNKDTRDRINAARELSNRGQQALADAMLNTDTSAASTGPDWHRSKHITAAYTTTLAAADRRNSGSDAVLAQRMQDYDLCQPAPPRYAPRYTLRHD